MMTRVRIKPDTTLQVAAAADVERVLVERHQQYMRAITEAHRRFRQRQRSGGDDD